MITNEVLFFAGFTVFILTMLVIDLGVFSKKDHVVSFKEAGIWSAVWIVFALIFYGILKTHGDLIHGIQNIDQLMALQEYAPDLTLDPTNFEKSLQLYRNNMAMEFIAGYLLEYMLSVDNIFVIILIFTSFGVSEKYYKKVLFWGILGAIIMRFTFIFVGSTLIHHFNWIMYLFGAFLIYTGVKMFLSKEDEDEKIDPNKHPVVKFASRNFSVYPRFVRENFFIRKQGKLFVTPLFLVVLIIEFTDLIFAVDSVPAVFAVTKDPYIVFFSNIFAILGLRSMFFFLANIMHIFHYLKTGLAVLLTFIGLKMIPNIHHFLHDNGFKTHHSLYIILGILGISVVASLLFPPKKKHEETETPKNPSLEKTPKS